MKFPLAFSCALFLAALSLAATTSTAQTPAAPQATPPATPAPKPSQPMMQSVPDYKPTPVVAPGTKLVNPDDVVLTIGTETFTRERFEAIMKVLTATFQQQGSQQWTKKQFAEQYEVILGLARSAEKEKMDQAPQVKDQLEFQRLSFLAQVAFNQISQRNQVISDDQIKAYYTAHAADQQQAKIRGILVAFSPPKGKDGKEPKDRTEDEAKALAVALREKIVKGADFAAVAKESSDEPETGPKGGDMGTVKRGQLPPNIEKAVFSLKVKEVSEPMPEASGFYIFQVEDLRDTTLEEATPRIRQTLLQQATMGTLDKVRADYPIKLNTDYFVDPPPNVLAPKKP
jgi:parvulin-like peptidyl-prolyl isomerase